MRKQLTSVLAIAIALLFTATSQAAVTTLSGSLFGSPSSGPTTTSPPVPNATVGGSDIAYSGNGATPFAIDVITGYAAHTIAHLDDGNYGNNFSWIGDTGRAISAYNTNTTNVDSLNTGFAGIDLPGVVPYFLGSFAFGRANNVNDSYGDRDAGTYYVQTTNVANPNALTPDAAWTTIGVITNDGNSGDQVRHLFTINSVVVATGLRIVVPAVGLGGGTDIDEIEIFGTLVPEPSSFVLAGLGAVGLAVVAKHRRNAKKA